MSRWAGKYVIGLTGNIGTGKSVIRRMLEHLGAYGIDADALAHRVIAKGAPGYQPIVETFGRWVLGPDGQVNRGRLARVAFSDPDALVDLEKIIHPYVAQGIDIMIRRASQPVIVIEAIKLLEAGLAQGCDSLWVTYASPETQLARLIKNRKMSEAEARHRIESQPPQEQKLKAASVVIKNNGSFEETWQQVQTYWQKLFPQSAAAQPAAAPAQKEAALKGELNVVRAGPRQFGDIAALMNRLKKTSRQVRREDVMAAFGEKAFLLLQAGQAPAGLIGWQVENLVACSTDILLDPSVPVDQALSVLINEMERASRELQCEASLVFVSPELAKQDALWRSLGYELRTPQTLGVQAWQEAAQENTSDGAVMYFKQLRQDRVMRPI